MKHFQLSKSDWKNLITFNIVDGEGNGFANTTKDFEKLVSISRFPTIIRVKNTYYEVRYVSGCFYPVWRKTNRVLEHYHIKQVGGNITADFIENN